MQIRSYFRPGFSGCAPTRHAAAALVLAALVALCGLLGLGFLEASTRNAMQHSMRRAVRVAELRGTIAYLDEYLTMSARVVALFHLISRLYEQTSILITTNLLFAE